MGKLSLYLQSALLLMNCLKGIFKVAGSEFEICFLKFFPKNYWINLVQTFKLLCFSETWSKEVFLGADFESNTCFVKFSTQYTFLGKIGPEIQNRFVLDGTRYKGVLKSAECWFELDNGFLKISHGNNFLEQIWSRNSDMLCFKWNSA